MEDVGPMTLTPALMGTDGALAEQLLLDLASAVGHMQALTRGRDQEYARIRQKYGPVEDNPNFDYAGYLNRSLTGLTEVIDELALIFPDNCVPSPDRIKLIDMDWGGFRHGLTDGVFGRTMYTYPEVLTIPLDLLDKMENEYRRRLTDTCPEAEHDPLFGRAIVEGCSFWMFYRLAGHLRRSLHHEYPHDFLWPKKQILQVIQAFEIVSRHHRAFPHLRDMALRLEDRLRQHWSEDNLAWAHFPVFR